MPERVVLEIEHNLGEQQRGVPNQSFKHIDVPEGQFARCRDAFVEVLFLQKGFQGSHPFVSALKVEGEEIGPILDHHGCLGPHTQVPQTGGIVFCELCQGLLIDRDLRSQGFKAHLQHFVARREEVGVVGTLCCNVAVTLQRRFKVSVGLCGVAQFHQANPLFLQTQIQGLGVNDGGGEIADLVEMPNQQLREHHVVRVRLNRPKQGHANELPVVLNGGQPQVSVEAVLDSAQVIGLGAQQGHVRVDHAFEVASHALKVGEFVIETYGAEFFRTLVGGKRHVEFV